MDHHPLFLCTIVGSPWGIHRLFRWYFYRHAIMLDGQDGQTALDYSADLVAGRWWPTTGLLVATLAVTLVPIAATNVILNSASSQLIAGLVNTVLAAAAFPYLTSVTLMIYYDLKLGREPLPPLQYASSE